MDSAIFALFCIVIKQSREFCIFQAFLFLAIVILYHHPVFVIFFPWLGTLFRDLFGGAVYF